MRLHTISAAAALIFASVIGVAVTAAVAQNAIGANQMANSLAGVSDTGLSMSGAQMREAVLNHIRDYPGTLPPSPLSFPQMEKLAQLIVEVEFDFNSATIKPSSYRTVGSIADALHNPILLGYGFLVIGHTDSVGGRQYNVGLSQRRAEAIRNALIDPFGVNPGILEAVGMGEEQLRDPRNPTSGVNRRVQLINVGKKFCFGRSGEQFVCQ
ncbi:MAG TPA: OmpA family protein [Xanthobacteraceae bacterium]|jgi:outer membrane protein OmpA-like peptidoglycan-associated protein|nr:OmpA family protein [Xanthobacteraceae bacterium]